MNPDQHIRLYRSLTDTINTWRSQWAGFARVEAGYTERVQPEEKQMVLVKKKGNQ